MMQLQLTVVLILDLVILNRSDAILKLGDLVVQLPNGKVQGTIVNTISSQQFYAWRGIPYGKPPINKLRFLPPVKAEPWEGIRDASKDSPACVSFGTFASDPVPLYGHSEDCLYLNVYSPVPVGSNSSMNPTRSVLFWIYGGGFYTGFSDFSFYDPTPFLEEDVIVVTFNYRLGALGFLSTEDEVILGNAGLKDQWLALNWVRENIAFFGGNPHKVTLFGESAGGMSVGYHILSPMSRPIMQSGSALSDLLYQSNARKFALNVASQIDPLITNTSTSEDIRDVLQAAPLELIKRWAPGIVGPVTEVKSKLSFITDPLYETLESGNFARVPVIVGYNSEELIGTGNGAGKVAHAQEVGYLFNISTQVIKTEQDFLARRRFVKLWTNFAKTSNPTPDNDSAELLQNVKWEPISKRNYRYLDIGKELQMKPIRKLNAMIFWDYIWKTYSYRPYNTY